MGALWWNCRTITQTYLCSILTPSSSVSTSLLSLSHCCLHPVSRLSPSVSAAAAADASLLLLLSCQLPRRWRCHGYIAAGQISWCLVPFRHVHKSLLQPSSPHPPVSERSCGPPSSCFALFLLVFVVFLSCHFLMQPSLISSLTRKQVTWD